MNKGIRQDTNTKIFLVAHQFGEIDEIEPHIKAIFKYLIYQNHYNEQYLSQKSDIASSNITKKVIRWLIIRKSNRNFPIDSSIY